MDAIGQSIYSFRLSIFYSILSISNPKTVYFVSNQNSSSNAFVFWLKNLSQINFSLPSFFFHFFLFFFKQSGWFYVSYLLISHFCSSTDSHKMNQKNFEFCKNCMRFFAFRLCMNVLPKYVFPATRFFFSVGGLNGFLRIIFDLNFFF